MHDPRPRTAVLAGATGLVGGRCFQALLHSPDYARLIVLTRRQPFNYVGIGRPHALLETHVVDFDHLSAADLTGADDVFCALGTTIKKAGSQAAFRKVDHDYIVNLARAAAEAGAKRFIFVSSVGADPHSRNFYLRVKGEAEQAISAIVPGNLPSSEPSRDNVGMFEAVHIFRPGLLLGYRAEKRTGERLAQVVMPAINPLLVGNLRKYRGIAAETVAQAMVSAASSDRTGVHFWEYAGIEILIRTPS